MFRHILVPIDGSGLSDDAVNAAVRLARENGAKISFLNVQPEYTFPVMVDLPVSFDISQTEYQASATKRSMEILGMAAKVAAGAGVQADTQPMLHNQPWEAICRAAESLQADLILMASHGRSGLDALLLGSETQKVLTHTKVPVLVYR